MICYKDMSFCASKVKEHTCSREFTKEDEKNAKKWWGGDDYPVMYGEFCKNKLTNKVGMGGLQ